MPSDGVEGLALGQRVAWVYAPGSYAERIAIPATSLAPVPDAIDDRTAAAAIMPGLTASHFANDSAVAHFLNRAGLSHKRAEQPAPNVGN